jgi:DNA-binding GntR family transcriptional regulator
MVEQSLFRRDFASGGCGNIRAVTPCELVSLQNPLVLSRRRMETVSAGKERSFPAGDERGAASMRKRAVEAGPVSVPLRHLIKDALLRGILSGRYPPGQRLLEMKIAAEFRTSQGPVREAFRELEATGLVVNMPRRGTYVAENTDATLREIYAVRGALEEAATRLATRLRGGDVADLQAHVDGMRAAAAGGDVEGLVEESVAFHRAILVSARNQLLLQIWMSLNIETRTTITLLADGIDLREVAETHQPIVDAMAGGDAEEAARLARIHQDYFEALPVARGEADPASTAAE